MVTKRDTATIKEVARRAGVAASSVSRVLNKHPDVSESMRRRVMASIEALGYQPDFLAQSLRRGSAQTVGFVVRDISNPLLAESVRGAETPFREAGYSVILTNSDGDPARDAEHIQLLNRRRVDGLILSLESESHPPTLEALHAVQCSVVLFDREVRAVRASAVFSDHYLGVREATLDMLRAVQNPEIGIIGGSTDVRATRERHRGYLDAHEAIGRMPVRRLIRSGSYGEDFGYEQTRVMLRDTPGLTGILVAGPQLTIGALSAIQEAGYAVGTDIDFVGCDGGRMMNLLKPPANTVERDAFLLGATAAHLLIELMAYHNPPRVTTLPTNYVRRGSVRTRTEVDAESTNTDISA